MCLAMISIVPSTQTMIGTMAGTIIRGMAVPPAGGTLPKIGIFTTQTKPFELVAKGWIL